MTENTLLVENEADVMDTAASSGNDVRINTTTPKAKETQKQKTSKPLNAGTERPKTS